MGDARDEYEYLADAFFAQAQELAEARAEVEGLRSLLETVTTCLEECVLAEYPDYLLKYPHNQQKFQNDMEPVHEARAALAKGGE